MIAPLARRGIVARPEIWDDAAADWARYDLVVLRSPWDYSRRRTEFVAWAASVPRLANPASVVAGNTDKRYLARLAEAGVPVVPTQWLEPASAPRPGAAGPDWRPPEDGVVVVKPAISAGSVETGRYDLADPKERGLSIAHADRLRAAGQVVMVQPYLSAVDSAGETALLYLGGRYSHAIRKGAMLDGPYNELTGLYREERIERREPSPAEREAADRVLAAAAEVLGAADLLYARVDLIPAADGTPTLVELELTEPSLFLAHGPGAPDRFAAAIAARLPG